MVAPERASPSVGASWDREEVCETSIWPPYHDPGEAAVMATTPPPLQRFRAINTSISVKKREEMESNRDDNMEQMAGSAGDLEVTALAKPINKVLSFLKIHTF